MPLPLIPIAAIISSIGGMGATAAGALASAAPAVAGAGALAKALTLASMAAPVIKTVGHKLLSGGHTIGKGLVKGAGYINKASPYVMNAADLYHTYKNGSPGEFAVKAGGLAKEMYKQHFRSREQDLAPEEKSKWGKALKIGGDVLEGTGNLKSIFNMANTHETSPLLAAIMSKQNEGMHSNASEIRSTLQNMLDEKRREGDSLLNSLTPKMGGFKRY